MNDLDVKKIVTKGDSNVNSITSLGEMKHVVERLTSIINHLKEFMLETIDDSIEKNMIIKQVQLIDRSTQYMKEKIYYITGDSGAVSLSKRTESRKMAATNLDLKIAKKTNLHNNVNYISIEDHILASGFGI